LDLSRAAIDRPGQNSEATLPFVKQPQCGCICASAKVTPEDGDRVLDAVVIDVNR
jgi:hypothetical protein